MVAPLHLVPGVGRITFKNWLATSVIRVMLMQATLDN